jgi:VanZ family protein
MNKVASPKLIIPWFRWLCVVFWMLVIFGFSAQPHSGEATKQYFGDMNMPVRKSAHMSEYAILYSLVRWATYGTTGGTIARLSLPLVWSIGYAATDEYHQSFVPGRSASLWDVLVDSAGVISGWIFCSLLLRAFSKS